MESDVQFGWNFKEGFTITIFRLLNPSVLV